jgi:hypothetical protein
MADFKTIKDPVSLRSWGLTLTFGLILCVSLLATGSLFAQESTEEEVTEYDFEEDVIDGSVKSPEDAIFDRIKPSTLESLIKIRKDFKAEIIKSAEGL